MVAAQIHSGTIADNSGDAFGGGLTLDNTSLVLTDVVITANTGVSAGGVGLQWSSLAMHNTSVTSNVGGPETGGVHISGAITATVSSVFVGPSECLCAESVGVCHVSCRALVFAHGLMKSAWQSSWSSLAFGAVCVPCPPPLSFFRVFKQATITPASFALNGDQAMDR